MTIPHQHVWIGTGWSFVYLLEGMWCAEKVCACRAIQRWWVPKDIQAWQLYGLEKDLNNGGQA